jgi:hypothetical protein
MRNAYKISIGISEGKISYRRHWSEWKENIQSNLKRNQV